MSATRIEISTEDGIAPAFTYGADGAPCVLLLCDGLGIRPAMHELAAKVAQAGYRVLMPDLFYRLGAYTSPDATALFTDPAVRAAWSARHTTSTAAALVRDIGVFVDRLGAAPIGVTGYCMGGRLALLAASTYPDRFAAVAAYHPGNVVTDAADSPHLGVGRIRATVYIGAATDDPTFTPEQRATLDGALAKVDHVIEVYPARHGFVPSDMPVHDAAATARHWDTMLALFARTLR